MNSFGALDPARKEVLSKKAGKKKEQQMSIKLERKSMSGIQHTGHSKKYKVKNKMGTSEKLSSNCWMIQMNQGFQLQMRRKMQYPSIKKREIICCFMMSLFLYFFDEVSHLESLQSHTENSSSHHTNCFSSLQGKEERERCNLQISFLVKANW